MSDARLQSLEDRVVENWGAPSFRENQKEVVMRAVDHLENKGRDGIVLSAPTGFGKSVTLHGIVNTMGVDAYYLTPLKSLQDQLTEDDMVGDDLAEIKGRSNYRCIQPDEDTTVDKGPCVRDSNFDCEIKDQCPYYAQKDKALAADITVANMSYMMAENMVPDNADRKFGDRHILIVDECQSIESWAINFVGTTISGRTVPDIVWDNIDLPPEQIEEDKGALAEFATTLSDISQAEARKAIKYGKIDLLTVMVRWIEQEVMPAVADAILYYDQQPQLGEDQVSEQEKLQRFSGKIDRFVADAKENDWVVNFQTDIKKNRPNERKIKFEPVKVGRFLEGMLWNRADKIILSSATVPGGNWLEEIGLGKYNLSRFNVPSTFPIENRPIITDEAIGKMTSSKRDENMGAMAKKIMELADRHEGQKGFVHCRGYNYINKLKRWLRNNGYRDFYKNRIMEQDRFNREESLQNWIDGDTQIFLSVSMDEGIDLDGDKCRWQVLMKALFPFMGDKRVSYRVNELNDWSWYYSKAAIQIQQAYGRGVRSEEDWCNFYILDESAAQMVDSRDYLFEDWFLDAVGVEPVGGDGV